MHSGQRRRGGTCTQLQGGIIIIIISPLSSLSFAAADDEGAGEYGKAEDIYMAKWGP